MTNSLKGTAWVAAGLVLLVPAGLSGASKDPRDHVFAGIYALLFLIAVVWGVTIGGRLDEPES